MTVDNSDSDSDSDRSSRLTIEQTVGCLKQITKAVVIT
jgi:hypothetical protein